MATLSQNSAEKKPRSSHGHGRDHGKERENKKGWRGNQNKSRGKPQNSTDGSTVDDDSPMLKTFRVFQAELDCRNDRYERIVKISRDITIESKRLIFLLQRVIGSDDPEKLLADAYEKIQELNGTKFLEIAKELDGQDSYQYLRAYTAGLQEYIEAVTFYYYLLDQKLVNLHKVQSQLIYPSSRNSTSSESISKESKDASSKAGVGGDVCSSSVTETESSVSEHIENLSEHDAKYEEVSPTTSMNKNKTISVHVPPSEYMLGVADYTGELMRMAINSVGAGDMDTPKVVANMMRVIHNAFSVFDNTSRELRKKGHVLRQSLQKVENACYTLTVRGSEIPQHMLADVFTSTRDDYSLNDDGEEFYD